MAKSYRRGLETLLLGALVALSEDSGFVYLHLRSRDPTPSSDPYSHSHASCHKYILKQQHNTKPAQRYALGEVEISKSLRLTDQPGWLGEFQNNERSRIKKKKKKSFLQGGHLWMSSDYTHLHGRLRLREIKKYARPERHDEMA